MNIKWNNGRYASEFARMQTESQIDEDFDLAILQFISKLLVDECEGPFIENGPKEYARYNIGSTDREIEEMIKELLDSHQPDTYWMQAFNFTQEYPFANKMGDVEPELEHNDHAVLMHERTRDDDNFVEGLQIMCSPTQSAEESKEVPCGEVAMDELD